MYTKKKNEIPKISFSVPPWRVEQTIFVPFPPPSFPLFSREYHANKTFSIGRSLAKWQSIKSSLVTSFRSAEQCPSTGRAKEPVPGCIGRDANVFLDRDTATLVAKHYSKQGKNHPPRETKNRAIKPDLIFATTAPPWSNIFVHFFLY